MLGGRARSTAGEPGSASGTPSLQFYTEFPDVDTIFESVDHSVQKSAGVNLIEKMHQVQALSPRVVLPLPGPSPGAHTGGPPEAVLGPTLQPNLAHSLFRPAKSPRVPCPLLDTTQSPPLSMARALTGTSSTPTESVPVGLHLSAGVPTDQMMNFHPGLELSQLGSSPEAPAGGHPAATCLPTFPQNSSHSLADPTAPSKGPCSLPGSSSTPCDAYGNDTIDHVQALSPGEVLLQCGPSPVPAQVGLEKLRPPQPCNQIWPAA